MVDNQGGFVKLVSTVMKERENMVLKIDPLAFEVFEVD